MNPVKLINKGFVALLAVLTLQLSAAETVTASIPQNQVSTNQQVKPSLTDLLGGMGAALNSGSYQLSMVYLHDGQVDSLRLSHLSSGSNQYDMLEHLQGARRLVVTKNGETWLTMGKEKIHISSEEESPVIRWRRQLELLARNITQYKVYISGISRVAGRLAYQINFISKDANRNSSRLWLDVNNFLPLKLDSLNADGKTIEQVLTINLNYPANLTEDYFQSFEGFEQLPTTLNGVVVDEFEKKEIYNLWTVEWLPVGFELSSTQIRSDEDIEYEQLIFSDGLSSLSVFVEPIKPKQKLGSRSFFRGDDIIFDVVMSDKRVTVVGNIPLKTAEKIASSVTKKAKSIVEVK